MRFWYLSWFFFLLGFGMLGVAAYVYFVPPAPPGPALEAESDVKITNAAAGLKREVVLRMTNQSGQPMRVLGLSMC